MSNKKLKDYEEQIRQCVKCGTCRAYCPVFGEQKRESVVARGKMALAQALLDGDVELDRRFAGDMSQCLLCGSCFDKCPNLVPADEIVMAARREITEKRGPTPFGRSLSLALKNPSLMKWGARGASVFSPILFKKVPEASGLRLRFPTPYVARDRIIPEIASRPFRDRHPEFIPGEEGKPLVAFFTGCMINFMYPRIGESVLRILRRMKMNIWIPSDQGCCGLPALSAGDGATVEELADRNLAAFEKRAPDVILTACASCHAGMSRHFAEFGDRQRELSEKVMDIHVFLEREGLTEDLKKIPRKSDPVRVAYHDPCHLRTKGITREPRNLLKALPGVEYIEMEGADRCCGLGGTFSVYHRETSKKIGSRKAPGIEASEADLVATACPGCMMQLQDIINQAGLSQKVVHLLDLIAEESPEHS